MPVSLTVKQLFSKCRVLGTGDQSIILSESEIYSLLQLSIANLNWEREAVGLPALSQEIPASYYDIPLGWFNSFAQEAPDNTMLLQILANAYELDVDFGLFFINLCSLHKRRKKYQRILQMQPRPQMDQIGPRSLLEYGICNSTLLSSWLVWRKWIFDIDNRSGQETGYLFEPILASCLGGEAISSSSSPVRRLNEAGEQQAGGRQIDCYVGADNTAYEFKLRVTIAASGQGRFAEELSFPRECAAAGLTPILLVLDPTPSARLQELAQAFIQAGGVVYTGESAWQHMDEKAGAIMATFIETYIRSPLLKMAHQDDAAILDLSLSWNKERILIEGGNEKYEILRT